ncbi:MAG TPA: sugar ABC transporter ATP-binding protein [Capsulimonadaceae bacterium]|nr:sugar ABC transporter ATP-binding protein [Capsulimonadaceae bacterium]
MPDTSAPNLPLLEMRGVSKRFGATVALDGVDLSVSAGEVLALVGENGAGKSTLMKVLSGAHAPDSGQMRLAGEPYRPRSPLEARRAGVAMIYQELSLAPDLSVAENILLGMEPTRGGLLDWKSLRRTAGEAMATVGHPDIALDTPVRRLSVAMQQLVEVARAVAVGCRVLVLDEPTSSLTRQDIARLFALIGRLKSQGHAIIYISHFLEEVKEVSDRFVVLRDGKSVGGGKTAETTEAEIIALMVGRNVSDLYPRSGRSPGEVVLEVRDLAGKRSPLSASLALRRGEVLGIAGLVGAGRTELIRAIFGLDPVRKGVVKIAHHSGGDSSPMVRWHEGVGVLSEDRKNEGLALGLSIAENVTLTRLPRLLSPARLDQEVERWAERMGVRRRSVRQSVGDLSGGNQQKVALARLLRHDADILLLDEPTRGIDVASKAEIYRVIDDLAAQSKAVLMISSYLPELLGVCDRIAVMRRGMLGPAQPTEELTEHRIMALATGAETVTNDGA